MTELSLGDPSRVPEVPALRQCVLDWYEQNRRDLPWRRTQDPYAIWVSEIMLQQTRVAAVIDRYREFLLSFPSVEALAQAAESDVLARWSGLGYYRRARMLHTAAQVILREHGGAMPTNSAGLRALPGIGAYTSAAIASIAYGEPVAVVDGNVERVVQRLAGWGSEESLGQAQLARATEQLASALLDPLRPGDFNQAMMELGATVCLPKSPACLTCPIRQFCLTRGEHPARKRAAMRSQPVAYALVLRYRRKGAEVLLDRRAEQHTVMPGMWELPQLICAEVPAAELRLTLRHAIMQVNYYVSIRAMTEQDLEKSAMPSEFRQWVPRREFESLPLTGLARKVLLRARLKELDAMKATHLTPKAT